MFFLKLFELQNIEATSRMSSPVACFPLFIWHQDGWK